jgi:ATP synthase protein I
VNDDPKGFSRNVQGKAARKVKAQRSGTHTAWFGLGMFGLIGWSVSIPTLVGAFLGAWHDAHHRSSHPWTLALLIAGLLIGCANAGYWISVQSDAIARDAKIDE